MHKTLITSLIFVFFSPNLHAFVCQDIFATIRTENSSFYQIELTKLTDQNNFLDFNTIAESFQRLTDIYEKNILIIDKMQPQEVKVWAHEMTLVLNKTGYLLDASKPYLELILQRVDSAPHKIIFTKENGLVSAVLAITDPKGGQVRVEISGFNGDISSPHLQLLNQLREHIKKSMTHFENLDARYYMWLNKMNYILDYSN